MSKTLAVSQLFNVNDNADKLDEDRAQLIHHLVAKLLYLSCRSWQDIQTPVVWGAKSE